MLAVQIATPAMIAQRLRICPSHLAWHTPALCSGAHTRACLPVYHGRMGAYNRIGPAATPPATSVEDV